MSSVGVSTHVRWRNSLGQFASAIDNGAQRAMVEAGERGALTAAALAPKKTRALAGSIHPILLGAHEAAWRFVSAYGMAQEKGAVPHSIGEPGQVLANKEDEFFARGPVWHPGNPATHFMRDSYLIVSGLLMGIVRKHMP